MTTRDANSLGRTLRAFFGDYLPRLRGLSRHTVCSYRDAMVLLLRYVGSRRNRSVVGIDLSDIDAEEVAAFLDHLERERGNSPSTRNVRLAALHAFFRYAAGTDPRQVERSQRILMIPFKRTRHRVVTYLEHDEIRAVFNAVDRSSPAGRRDYVLPVTMFNTGARVQELLDIEPRDLQLERPFQVLLRGKGRRERICPLWSQTAAVLREFCRENGVDLRGSEPIFRNGRGHVLTRFGVRYILAKYLAAARAATPTLARKKLHPHMMRHSTAVHLLKSGIDLSTISHH